MNIKALAVSVFLFLSVFNSAFAQSNAEIKFESIYVNGSRVPEKNWNTLRFGTQDSVSFILKFPQNIRETVYSRVYLNGAVFHPEKRITGNKVTIDGLDEGSYFMKIESYTMEGWVSDPIIYHFTVTFTGSQQENVNKNDSASGLPIYAYILVFIVIIQFGVIIYFGIKKKRNGSGGSFTEKELRNEIADFKYSYNRLKEQMKQQVAENAFLKEQIKNLEINVGNLEKTNVYLIQQKERLANSKIQLEELQKQKEELFAHAIHDIKNPASAIRSYVELLNSYDLNATEQQEIMSSIMESSQDIVKLSQEMCAIIAKSESTNQLNLENASVKKIIDDVVSHNLAYAKSKKIKLTRKTSEALPEIEVDVEKIEESLDNLINNAIKYGPSDTTVEVTSYRKADWIVVEVRDTGFGLSEEDIKKAFHKGAILSSKPTGVELSSGLGLWLVKQNIEAHKGKVWVESKLGVGSTFAFEIPIKKK